jgi:transcriptional regulator with XRE-family HTH domain
MTTDISKRLKTERLRLDLTQLELAKLVYRGSKTGMLVSRWERGISTPNARTMELLGHMGFDVKFLITGTRERSVDKLVKNG